MAVEYAGHPGADFKKSRLLVSWSQPLQADAVATLGEVLPASWRGCGSSASLCIRRSEPGGQGFEKTLVGAVSDPRDISVGPDQHGRGGSDGAEYWKVPCASVSSVEQPNATHP